jgi:hypothetical protein
MRSTWSNTSEFICFRQKINTFMSVNVSRLTTQFIYITADIGSDIGGEI